MENTIKEEIIRNPYNEVYSILIALGNSFINKTPREILIHIAKNMTYKIENGKKVYSILKYDLKVSLKIQGISKEAISIIYYLYYNYWCTSDKEKSYLQNIIRNNEKKLEELKKEKFKNVEMFPDKDKPEKPEKHEENMLITVSDKRWYKDIFTKIAKVFKR